MLIANTESARKNIEDRQKAMAAMVHWCLEEAATNIEPLPRLCLSFDIFGKSLVSAPTAIDRLRSNIKTSCQEAVARWDVIGSPEGYDGEDWR